MKDSAAAEALSHLAQGAFMPGGHPNQFPPHGMHPNQPPIPPMAGEPGPSSHPRGPPNLGELSAIATALQATAHQAAPPPQPDDDNMSAGGGDGSGGEGDKPAPTKTGGRRGGRNPTMTNDEWARIRKDNHVRLSFHLVPEPFPPPPSSPSVELGYSHPFSRCCSFIWVLRTLNHPPSSTTSPDVWLCFLPYPR